LIADASKATLDVMVILGLVALLGAQLLKGLSAFHSMPSK
jgi:hypothetical protein